MAISMGPLSRRLSRSLLSAPHRAFCSTQTPDLEDSEPEPRSPENTRTFREPLLENGLDQGIYKAIIVGRVGQRPIQKTLKSGLLLTVFSVGTGGIRSNRRPLSDESPRDYANRASVQWHRVCVYPERLGALVMNNVVPGSMLYLDGNLETKVFTDPITGIARRLREISIRRYGRIVFLGKVSDAEEPTQAELRGFVC